MRLLEEDEEDEEPEAECTDGLGRRLVGLEDGTGSLGQHGQMFIGEFGDMVDSGHRYEGSMVFLRERFLKEVSF